MRTQTVVITRAADGTEGRTERSLQAIRIGYGAALLLMPGPAIRLTTRHAVSRRTCRTARLLGARHLVQAAVTAVAPLPETFVIGGQVDSAHALSMLLLAAVSRPGRRAALLDALIEAAFAAAGFSLSAGADPAAGHPAPSRRVPGAPTPTRAASS